MEQSNISSRSFTLQETFQAKGIAVCLLLLHHLSSDAPGFLGQTALDARVCVWIFAFLSGFGLTISYRKRPETQGNLSFALRHLWSLMVPFWFLYILVSPFALIPNGAAAAYEGHASYWILDFLGIADLFGTPHLSFSWWYISFAQMLIVFTPLLIELVKQYGGFSFLALFALIALLGPGYVSYYGGAYSAYFYAAVLGILCAEKDVFGKAAAQPAPWYRGLLLAGAAWLLAHLGSVLQDTGWNLMSPVFSSISAFLICLLSFRYLRWHRLSVCLQNLGKLSYVIFATHGFILGKFRSYIFITGKFLPSFLTLLLLSVSAAVLIRLLQEKIGYNKFMSGLFQRMARKPAAEKV